MIENKIFVGGGLNQDADKNFLKPNEWTDALNIRVTDKLNNLNGVVSNIKGNTEVVYSSLPGGTNKCIGSYANENTGKLYSFIWNSTNEHVITEYDPTVNTITKVLQASYLNFQEYELINGASIIGGNLLYWTDGYNPPRGIDITKAKTGTYYTDSTSISLAKPPPQDIIECTYANDSSDQATSNRLKEQLFQFRYLYVYEDGSRSAWSSCSAIAYPNLEVTSAVDTAAYRNNHIILQFNVGTKFVKTIEIAAQVKGVALNGTQDWFNILSVDRSVAIADASYQYDPLINKSTFSFYNDGLYQSVDVREVDLQYDFVPLVSKTLDIVNGNVLVLGNNTEGYDNIDLDVDITVSYENQILLDRLTLGDETGGTQSTQAFSVIFTGTPVAGDTVSWEATYRDREEGSPIIVNGTYTLSDSNTGDLVSFANSLGNDIDSTANVYWIYEGYELVTNGIKLLFSTDVEFPDLTTIDIESVTLNAEFTNSVGAYKTNSRYQFGLVYYDEFNRSTYVQTNQDLLKATSSWGATEGESPAFNWTINHSAPTSFVKYQWVRTEQLTHKNFLFWSASSVTANPQNSDFYDLNINTFNSYNTKYPDSILSYEFTPGDRCTIHKDNATWKTGYDVAVIGYSPSAGILTIQKKSVLNGGASGILLEVYTPKTRANQTQEQFFYEFGEVYSCSGGVHSVSAGTFNVGDIYAKSRIISGASGTELEDPNYSDFYISNYSSNGRTNIFAPQAKQLNLPTDIRYSDTYVPNTNINGLSRFYGEAFETYDRVNGSIQKLAVRDNYLMAFQELKTGYIPLEQSIIEDQGGGDPNVAISTKLLNKIRYFAGDYGIGKHPESFARFAGVMYFADPNRGQVLKLSGGIEPIGIIGMDSYFTNKLTALRAYANGKVTGSYDPYNDEYVLTFRNSTTPASFDATIAFSEAINRWTSFYSLIPDIGGYIFNQYVTYKNGKLYKENTNSSRNNFYGSSYVSTIKVVFNGSPTLIKTFIGIMEQSNFVWVPSAITTSNGQTSALEVGDFAEKEKVFFASFLRATSFDDTYGIEGEDLKGNWIQLTMSTGETTQATLFSADLTFIPSYQGIK